jgi:IS1 family transposase
MNKLSTAKRVQVVAALVEGASVNSTVRMTGISKPTILKLIAELGEACWNWHDERVRGLSCARIQCDELWAFCYAKAKNVPAHMKDEWVGDVWTWTAIDADTKLMVSWLIGRRDSTAANQFMNDVADRLAHRVQVTTDAHHTYLNAVTNAFGTPNVDYAQLIKIYGQNYRSDGKYSPPECIGVRIGRIVGDPNPKHVSTSFVERSNLTVRMGIRRYTRLTNGFSKKIDNHVAMTSIFLTYYNWCRVHQTLRVTPAMATGLTTRLWEIEDLVGLMK